MLSALALAFPREPSVEKDVNEAFGLRGLILVYLGLGVVIAVWRLA